MSTPVAAQTPPQRRPMSLRNRLLHGLVWPLLAVIGLSAAVDYRQAVHRARDNQDLALHRVAAALASRLDLDADDAADDNLGLHLTGMLAAMQRAEDQDRLYFLVEDAQRQVVGGFPALAALRQVDARVHYADQRWHEEDLRVINLPHRAPMGAVHIIVAETTHRRDAQIGQALVDTVVPNLVLLLMAALCVAVGVHFALRPLDDLDQQVGRRKTTDLRPLPTEGLPQELRPLVDALNRLMGNLDLAMASQQDFLSNAAHQLRTPLAGIQTQLELACQSADGAQRQRLQALQGALQRLGRTTHQMLALSRTGAQASQAAEFTDVDLQWLCEAAASDWLDAALQAQVDLGFETQAAVVRGSAWMLREALGNLIHNALRHAPPGSAVTVRCGLAPETCAWLSVTDEGPGIPDALRDKVTTRFFQAPGTQAGGSGLGLAIVQEVAQRHDAELVLATPPSGGLHVLLRFPPPPTASSGI